MSGPTSGGKAGGKRGENARESNGFTKGVTSKDTASKDVTSKEKVSKDKKGEQEMQENIAQDQASQGQAAVKAGSPIMSKTAGVDGASKGAGAGNGIGDRDDVGAAQAAPKPTVSHMLGEVTWLLSQSPTHKHFAIGDLEWLVMPAILLEQFRVFHGEKHPLGFALWATFSEEVEARFKEQAAAGQGVRLRPQDWKSGDRLWLIELVAPFATAENKLQDAMLADLVQGVFKGKSFKLHTTDPSTGKREEKEVKG